MNWRAFTLTRIVLGLAFAGPHGALAVEQTALVHWQLQHLFEPTPTELRSEVKGRVVIYDGLTDRDVKRALDEQFQRVDHMMFTHIVVTDADGKPRRDAATGAMEYEDDGCD